jgi:hypothetical protein
MVKQISCLLALLLLPFLCHAWGGTGHQIVALIAWEKHRCRIGARFSGLAAEQVEVPREELLKAIVGG